MLISNPYIIAEIGSNWTSLEDCLHSIIQAKLAGANAAKFQLYTSHALYGIDYFMKWSLPIAWIPQLKDQCDRVGIDFMCSAFSPELIDVVHPFVKVHKVASSEMCHVRMLECLNQIGKPVILSTGAQTVSDIHSALNIFKNVPVTLMYCVSAYPAYEIDLDIIDKLKERFNIPVGFSDHSIDYLNLPFFAWKTYNVPIIEKHFKAIDAQTPDSEHSLNRDQFRKMVQKIKGEYVSVIGPTPSEKDMILRHKRRLIAIKSIKRGDILEEGYNFGIYRSLMDDSKGMVPFAIDSFIHKKALVDIEAGHGIGPTDIQMSF